jgi:hypothetical protein
MERAAMRSQLQSFTPVARSCQPRGASPAVRSGWLNRACGAAFFCLVKLGPLIAGSEAIAANRLDTKMLVDMANRYQVPMPTKDARVVFASIGWWTRVSDDLFLHVYSPAFLLEERRDGSIVILRGLKREVLPKRESTDPPAIRPFSAKNIDPRTAGFVADFHDRPALVCAVQLAARGDEATAQIVWQQVATTKKWTSEYHRMRGMHTEDDVPDAKEEIRNPALVLGECIFDDLESRLTQKDADWQTIYDRMKALFKELPDLSKGDRKVIFDDLATTLTASPPAPGSIEAKLLDWSRRPHERPTYDPFEQACKPDPLPDAPAREIVLRGFDAIPPLLELLRDNRLTAHCADRDRGKRILRLRHLASILLSGMTGAPDCRHGCDEGERDAAAQREWWERAHLRNEVDVFSEGIFERENGALTSDRVFPVRILAAKYPSALPVLLRQFVKETNGDRGPWAIAEALANSALPKETRIRALCDAARQGSLENQRCLIQILAKLDARKSAELLLPVLKKLPPDSDGPYWTCPQAAFSHIAMELEDDEVWREFQRAAQRSSVGLRLEMIGSECSCGTPEKNRGRRIAFLASFLNDVTVRTIPLFPDNETAARQVRSGRMVQSKYDGLCAASTFKKIEVRDFAAMELGYLLGVKGEPKDAWTADQWLAFRGQVRERLVAEKFPNLKLNK